MRACRAALLGLSPYGRRASERARVRDRFELKRAFAAPPALSAYSSCWAADQQSTGRRVLSHAELPFSTLPGSYSTLATVHQRGRPRQREWL